MDAEDLVVRALRRKGPVAEIATAADARKCAEIWIREQVAALGVSDE